MRRPITKMSDFCGYLLGVSVLVIATERLVAPAWGWAWVAWYSTLYLIHRWRGR